MLAISHIWLCLFLENSSILNKMSILGQPPRQILLEKTGGYLFAATGLTKEDIMGSYHFTHSNTE